MNWARGFFRIWLVCSVLWVGIVIALYYGSFRRAIDYKLGNISVAVQVDGSKIEFPSNATAEEIRSIVLEGIKNGSIKTLFADVELEDDPTAIPLPPPEYSASLTADAAVRDFEQNGAELYQEFRQTIKGPGVLLLFPVLTLILGHLVAWTLKGFR